MSPNKEDFSKLSGSLKEEEACQENTSSLFLSRKTPEFKHNAPQVSALDTPARDLDPGKDTGHDRDVCYLTQTESSWQCCNCLAVLDMKGEKNNCETCFISSCGTESEEISLSNMEKKILLLRTNKYRMALYEAEHAVMLHQAGDHSGEMDRGCNNFRTTIRGNRFERENTNQSTSSDHTTHSEYCLTNCKSVCYVERKNVQNVQGCDPGRQDWYKSPRCCDGAGISGLDSMGTNFQHMSVDIIVMPSWQSGGNMGPGEATVGSNKGQSCSERSDHTSTLDTSAIIPRDQGFQAVGDRQQTCVENPLGNNWKVFQDDRRNGPGLSPGSINQHDDDKQLHLQAYLTESNENWQLCDDSSHQDNDRHVSGHGSQHHIGDKQLPHAGGNQQTGDKQLPHAGGIQQTGDKQLPHASGIQQTGDKQLPHAGGNQQTGDKQLPHASGIQQTGDKPLPHAGGNQQTGDKQLPHAGGIQQAGDKQLPHASGIQQTGDKQLPHAFGIHQTGDKQLPHAGGNQQTGDKQLPYTSSIQQTGDEQLPHAAGIQQTSDEQLPHAGGIQQTGDEQLPHGAGIQQTGDEQLLHAAGIQQTSDEQLPHGGGIQETGDKQLPHAAGIQQTGDEQLPHAGGNQQTGDSIFLTANDIYQPRDKIFLTANDIQQAAQYTSCVDNEEICTEGENKPSATCVISEQTNGSHIGLSSDGTGQTYETYADDFQQGDDGLNYIHADDQTHLRHLSANICEPTHHNLGAGCIQQADIKHFGWETEDESRVQHEKQLEIAVTNGAEYSERIYHLMTPDVSKNELACTRTPTSLDLNNDAKYFHRTQEPSLNLSPIIPFSYPEDEESQIELVHMSKPSSALKLSDKIEIHVSDISDAEPDEGKPNPQYLVSDWTTQRHIEEIVLDSDSNPDETLSSFPTVVNLNIPRTWFRTERDWIDQEEHVNTENIEEKPEFDQIENTDHLVKASNTSKQFGPFGPFIASVLLPGAKAPCTVSMATLPALNPVEKHGHQFTKENISNSNLSFVETTDCGEDSPGKLSLVSGCTKSSQISVSDMQQNNLEEHIPTLYNRTSIDTVLDIPSDQKVAEAVSPSTGCFPSQTSQASWGWSSMNSFDTSPRYSHNLSFSDGLYKSCTLSPPAFSSSEDDDLDKEFHVELPESAHHSPLVDRDKNNGQGKRCEGQPNQLPTAWVSHQLVNSRDRNVFDSLEAFESGIGSTFCEDSGVELKTPIRVGQKISPDSQNSSKSKWKGKEINLSDTSVDQQHNDVTVSISSILCKSQSDDKIKVKSIHVDTKPTVSTATVWTEHSGCCIAKPCFNFNKGKSSQGFTSPQVVQNTPHKNKQLKKKKIPIKQTTDIHTTVPKNSLCPCEVRLVNVHFITSKNTVDLKKLSAKSRKQLGLIPISVNHSVSDKKFPISKTTPPTSRTDDKHDSDNTQFFCVFKRLKQMRSEKRQHRIAEVQANLIKIAETQNSSSLQNISMEEPSVPEDCATPDTKSVLVQDTTSHCHKTETSPVRKLDHSGVIPESQHSMEGEAIKLENILTTLDKEIGMETPRKNVTKQNTPKCKKSKNLSISKTLTVVSSSSPTSSRKAKKGSSKNLQPCENSTMGIDGSSRSPGCSVSPATAEGKSESRKDRERRESQEDHSVPPNQATPKQHEKNKPRKCHSSVPKENQSHKDDHKHTVTKTQNKSGHVSVSGEPNIACQTSKETETSCRYSKKESIGKLDTCTKRSKSSISNIESAVDQTTAHSHRKESSISKRCEKPSPYSDKPKIEGLNTKLKKKASPSSEEKKLKRARKSSCESELGSICSPQKMEKSSGSHNIFSDSKFRIPKKCSSDTSSDMRSVSVITNNSELLTTTNCATALENADKDKRYITSKTKTSNSGAEAAQKVSEKSSPTLRTDLGPSKSKAKTSPPRTLPRTPTLVKTETKEGKTHSSRTHSARSSRQDCSKVFLLEEEQRLYRDKTPPNQGAGAKPSTTREGNTHSSDRARSTCSSKQHGQECTKELLPKETQRYRDKTASNQNTGAKPSARDASGKDANLRNVSSLHSHGDSKGNGHSTVGSPLDRVGHNRDQPARCAVPTHRQVSNYKSHGNEAGRGETFEMSESKEPEHCGTQVFRGKDIPQLAEVRRNRRGHPYSRPGPERSKRNHSSFDLAYKDLQDLMQCLTSNTYRTAKRHKQSLTTTDSQECRFFNYRFVRASLPEHIHTEKEPEQLIRKEDITDFELRRQLADEAEELAEQTFLKHKDDSIKEEDLLDDFIVLDETLCESSKPDHVIPVCSSTPAKFLSKAEWGSPAVTTLSSDVQDVGQPHFSGSASKEHASKKIENNPQLGFHSVSSLTRQLSGSGDFEEYDVASTDGHQRVVIIRDKETCPKSAQQATESKEVAIAENVDQRCVLSKHEARANNEAISEQSSGIHETSREKDHQPQSQDNLLPPGRPKAKCDKSGTMPANDVQRRVIFAERKECMLQASDPSSRKTLKFDDNKELHTSSLHSKEKPARNHLSEVGNIPTIEGNRKISQISKHDKALPSSSKLNPQQSGQSHGPSTIQDNRKETQHSVQSQVQQSNLIPVILSRQSDRLSNTLSSSIDPFVSSSGLLPSSSCSFPGQSKCPPRSGQTKTTCVESLTCSSQDNPLTSHSLPAHSKGSATQSLTHSSHSSASHNMHQKEKAQDELVLEPFTNPPQNGSESFEQREIVNKEQKISDKSQTEEASFTNANYALKITEQASTFQYPGFGIADANMIMSLQDAPAGRDPQKRLSRKSSDLNINPASTFLSDPAEYSHNVSLPDKSLNEGESNSGTSSAKQAFPKNMLNPELTCALMKLNSLLSQRLVKSTVDSQGEKRSTVTSLAKSRCENSPSLVAKPQFNPSSLSCSNVKPISGDEPSMLSQKQSKDTTSTHPANKASLNKGKVHKGNTNTFLSTELSPPPPPPLPQLPKSTPQIKRPPRIIFDKQCRVYKANPNLKASKYQLHEVITYSSRDPRLHPPSKKERQENRKKDSLKSGPCRTIRIVTDIPLEPVEQLKKKTELQTKAEISANKACVVDEGTKVADKLDGDGLQKTEIANGIENTSRQETPTEQPAHYDVEESNVLGRRIVSTRETAVFMPEEIKHPENGIELKLGKLVEDGDNSLESDVQLPPTSDGVCCEVVEESKGEGSAGICSGTNPVLTNSNNSGTKSDRDWSNSENQLDLLSEESFKLTAAVCGEKENEEHLEDGEIIPEQEILYTLANLKTELPSDIELDESDIKFPVQDSSDERTTQSNIFFATERTQPVSFQASVSDLIKIETPESWVSKGFAERNFEYPLIQDIKQEIDDSDLEDRKEPKNDPAVCTTNFTDVSEDPLEILRDNIKIELDYSEASPSHMENKALGPISSRSGTRTDSHIAPAQTPHFSPQEAKDIELLGEGLELSEGEIVSSPDSSLLYDSNTETKSKARTRFTDKKLKPKVPKLKDSSPMCPNYYRQKLFNPIQPHIMSMGGQQRKYQQILPKYGSFTSDIQRYSRGCRSPPVFNMFGERKTNRNTAASKFVQKRGSTRYDAIVVEDITSPEKSPYWESRTTSGRTELPQRYTRSPCLESHTSSWHLSSRSSRDRKPSHKRSRSSSSHSRPRMSKHHKSSKSSKSRNRSKSPAPFYGSGATRKHVKSKPQSKHRDLNYPRSHTKSRSLNRSHSPRRSRSPDRSHFLRRWSSPYRPHSPRRLRSPYTPHSPRRSRSPYRTHSPRRSRSLNRSHSPRRPRTPKKSHSPRRPRTPESSHSPKRSRSPERSHSPRRPRTPESPHSPKRSRSPERSHSPRRPRTPESPHSPRRPRTPESPHSPRRPRTLESPHYSKRSRSPERSHSPRRPRTQYKSHSPRRPRTQEKSLSPRRSRSPRMTATSKSPKKYRKKSLSKLSKIQKRSLSRTHTRSRSNSFECRKTFEPPRCDRKPPSPQERQMPQSCFDRVYGQPLHDLNSGTYSSQKKTATPVYSDNTNSDSVSRSPRSPKQRRLNSQSVSVYSKGHDFSRSPCPPHLERFPYRAKNVSERHRLDPLSVSVSSNERDPSPEWRKTERDSSNSEQFGGEELLQESKPILIQSNDIDQQTDVTEPPLQAAPTQVSTQLSSLGKNQETHLACSEQDSCNQKSDQILPNTRENSEQSVLSYVSEMLAKIRKDEEEAGLTLAEQVSSNGSLYSDRPQPIKKSSKGKSGSEEKPWRHKMRQRCDMRRHCSDPPKPSEKCLRPPSGKSCSGVIMAKTNALFKYKPLCEMLGLMEEQSKRGLKWILEIHVASLCEIIEQKRHESCCLDYDEVKRCISLIYDYEVKGLIRRLQGCQCSVKNSWNLMDAVECLMSRREKEEVPVILCDPIRKSIRLALLQDHPELRFADMTTIPSVIKFELDLD